MFHFKNFASFNKERIYRSIVTSVCRSTGRTPNQTFRLGQIYLASNRDFTCDHDPADRKPIRVRLMSQPGRATDWFLLKGSGEFESLPYYSIISYDSEYYWVGTTKQCTVQDTLQLICQKRDPVLEKKHILFWLQPESASNPASNAYFIHSATIDTYGSYNTVVQAGDGKLQAKEYDILNINKLTDHANESEVFSFEKNPHDFLTDWDNYARDLERARESE